MNSIIAVQLLTRSDLVTTLTAEAISVVPGTVVVDIDRERGLLYLHALGTRTHGRHRPGAARRARHRGAHRARHRHARAGGIRSRGAARTAGAGTHARHRSGSTRRTAPETEAPTMTFLTVVSVARRHHVRHRRDRRGLPHHPRPVDPRPGARDRRAARHRDLRARRRDGDQPAHRHPRRCCSCSRCSRSSARSRSPGSWRSRMPRERRRDRASALLILRERVPSMAAGIGILRFPDVLTRLHAATKPQVLGLATVLARDRAAGADLGRAHDRGARHDVPAAHPADDRAHARPLRRTAATTCDATCSSRTTSATTSRSTTRRRTPAR